MKRSNNVRRKTELISFLALKRQLCWQWLLGAGRPFWSSKRRDLKSSCGLVIQSCDSYGNHQDWLQLCFSSQGHGLLGCEKNTSPAEPFLLRLEGLLRVSSPIHPAGRNMGKANRYCQGWRDQNNWKEIEAVHRNGRNELHTLPPVSSGPALPARGLALSCRTRLEICLLFHLTLEHLPSMLAAPATSEALPSILKPAAGPCKADAPLLRGSHN